MGYYLCNVRLLDNLFSNTYKAFQIGVYTDYGIANTYKEKYNNSVIIKDNELYRVYAAILKNDINIENMSKYLINEINEYERIMNNNNEIVFLEINKLIIEKYKESL